MKYRKRILPILLSICMLAACGRSETMSEQDIAVMESIAESVAESVAASMVEAMKSENENSEEVSLESEEASQPSEADQAVAASSSTPIGDGFAAEHGALKVDGVNLVDQNGDPIQLYGMSTHGIAWFPQFVSRDSFQTLRDDWNTNCVRLAMYTHEYNGYCSGGDQDYLKSMVRGGVDAATELVMKQKRGRIS